MIRQEVREDRRIARAFVDAAARGDVDQFMSFARELSDATVNGWNFAIKGAGRLLSTTPEIRSAFINIWVENKSLSRHVDNRRALVDALRVLLPCDYHGPPLHLYRGAQRNERRRRRYGFSWTTKLEIARNFADGHTKANEKLAGMGHSAGAERVGIVLQTRVPAQAIMLMREDESYYDEGEVVVDLFQLGKISVWRNQLEISRQL